MAFQGDVIRLPIGQRGFNGSKNVSQLGPDELVSAVNLSFADGTIQKEGGATKYNSSAITGTPQIVNGIDYEPVAGTHRIIVGTSAGTILRDTGAGTFPTTVKSGLTITDNCVFAIGGAESAGNNRKLFIFTGADAVQVVDGDGTTSADITTPPADWSGANQPTVGLIHENRVFGTGNPNDPHRWYFSTPTDHEDFSGTGSGTISVYPGEGLGFTAGISFKGFMLAFKKPRGVYLIDTSNATVANWRAVRITDTIGVVSPECVTMIDNEVALADNLGHIYLISSVEDFGNVFLRNASIPSKMDVYMRDTNYAANAAKGRLVFYDNKRELHFAHAGAGSSVNNRRLIVDFNGQVPRFLVSERDTAVSMWLRDVSGDEELMMGDNAGFVWRLDQDTKNKDSAGYEGSFETAPSDLSFANPRYAVRDKTGAFLEIVHEPKGNHDLSVQILWDGNLTDTVNFSMGAAGAALGSFVLDTDALSGASASTTKHKISGSGRRFAMIAKNSGADQDFSLADFYLHIQENAEDIR